MKVKNVLEAPSGRQALERLSTSLDPVSMVICDWNMSGMSGMDLFRQVHASSPTLPFLLLTGTADLESVVAAKKAGVHGYLAKPISPQQLQAKVASFISAARQSPKEKAPPVRAGRSELRYIFNSARSAPFRSTAPGQPPCGANPPRKPAQRVCAPTPPFTPREIRQRPSGCPLWPTSLAFYLYCVPARSAPCDTVRMLSGLLGC
jgi:CheY-like chemotaxis protein